MAVKLTPQNSVQSATCMIEAEVDENIQKQNQKTRLKKLLVSLVSTNIVNNSIQFEFDHKKYKSKTYKLPEYG